MVNALLEKQDNIISNAKFKPREKLQRIPVVGGDFNGMRIIFYFTCSSLSSAQKGL